MTTRHSNVWTSATATWTVLGDIVTIAIEGTASYRRSEFEM